MENSNSLGGITESMIAEEVQVGQREDEQLGVVSSFAYELGFRSCVNEITHCPESANAYVCMTRDEQDGNVATHAYLLAWDRAQTWIRNRKHKIEGPTTESSMPYAIYCSTCNKPLSMCTCVRCSSCTSMWGNCICASCSACKCSPCICVMKCASCSRGFCTCRTKIRTLFVPATP